MIRVTHKAFPANDITGLRRHYGHSALIDDPRYGTQEHVGILPQLVRNFLRWTVHQTVRRHNDAATTGLRTQHRQCRRRPRTPQESRQTDPGGYHLDPNDFRAR